MSTAKKLLREIIDGIPDNQVPEVIDFIQFLNAKREKEMMSALLAASTSSTDFWNNEIDDEVWNNV